MSEEWEFQIRASLTDRAAELICEGGDAAELAPLVAVAERHEAQIRSQYDAFAEFVAESEAAGETQSALYKWTRVTIDDPVKAAKHKKIVTFYVKGEEVYPRAAAEALEADLAPLIGGPLVVKVNKYDSNPANNPQPPAHLMG
jgi:soluble lytic murein transglycosylase-like protein